VSPSPQSPRHIVVDTDVGPDDLMAIAYLLGRPDVRIDAITVVNGLASVKGGAESALRLLGLAGAGDVPVYLGASTHLQPTSPFPAEWVRAAEKMGLDAAPAVARRPEAEAAAAYLQRVMSGPEGAVEILALGPLTNLALAIRGAGAGRVSPLRLVIMGGAVDVPGNLAEFSTENSHAEWNLYADPLAAREVLASPLRVELVPLDATNQVRLDACFVRAVTGGPETPLRRYVGTVLEGARDWIEGGEYYAWDPLAAVALAEPGVLTGREERISVELAPPYEGWSRRAEGGAPIQVAVGADAERFARSFAAALGPMDRAIDAGSFFCAPGVKGTP
jgi:inosine-uridine nucleoside N-ribohydrolase